MPDKHQALFKKHCVSCHGPEKQEGKFRVDDLSFTITNIESAEKWQKVLNQMNSGRCRRRMRLSPRVRQRLTYWSI